MRRRTERERVHQQRRQNTKTDSGKKMSKLELFNTDENTQSFKHRSYAPLLMLEFCIF